MLGLCFNNNIDILKQKHPSSYRTHRWENLLLSILSVNVWIGIFFLNYYFQQLKGEVDVIVFNQFILNIITGIYYFKLDCFARAILSWCL